jgi:hypothetical protein
MDGLQFVSSSIGGHLACFHLLDITDLAMSICVQGYESLLPVLRGIGSRSPSDTKIHGCSGSSHKLMSLHRACSCRLYM